MPIERINRPVRFPGTPEQAAANYRTHYFITNGDPEDGDYRCMDCDCKPGHVAASYPCGTEPPRETIEVER